MRVGNGLITRVTVSVYSLLSICVCVLALMPVCLSPVMTQEVCCHACCYRTYGLGLELNLGLMVRGDLL